MSFETAFSFAFPAVVLGIAIAACKSDGSSSGGPAPTPLDVFGTTGVVSGPADSHCAGKSVTIDPAQCTTPKKGTEPPAADAGNADAGALGGSDYGPTNNGFEADDDDCKYHLKWAVTTNAENADAYFTVVLTTKSSNAAAAGLPVSAEVFLDETHPAPNSGQKTTESSTPGTYVVGPIHFDAPGKWTVRFHFHEDCADSEESPHGHAAFFVQIP